MIGSLGGPETAGVGWAAGIERLAMLLDEPESLGVDVAIVAESDEFELTAVALTTAFRRAGISADAVVSGSPKKRYDKALKMNPAYTVSLSRRDGMVSVAERGLKGKFNPDQLRAIIASATSQLE